LPHKAVHNRVHKFSQGHSKVVDDARPGGPVEIMTEATVKRVEELIRTDRRITIDSAATALGCSHGLAHSIIHDNLKFRKVCAQWVPRELKDRERITEWVCPCKTSYGMQTKKICLTGLLPVTNHRCITTNSNQSVLQCNGNIRVHLQPKCLRSRHKQEIL
jgi:hypothetical protein